MRLFLTLPRPRRTAHTAHLATCYSIRRQCAQLSPESRQYCHLPLTPTGRNGENSVRASSRSLNRRHGHCRRADNWVIRSQPCESRCISGLIHAAVVRIAERARRVPLSGLRNRRNIALTPSTQLKCLPLPGSENCDRSALAQEACLRCVRFHLQCHYVPKEKPARSMGRPYDR